MALKYSTGNSSVWIAMQITTQSDKTVQQVREYDLFLDIDFDAVKFSGRVMIDMSSIDDVSLDAVDLEVTSVKTNGRKLPFEHHENAVDIETGKFSGSLESDRVLQGSIRGQVCPDNTFRSRTCSQAPTLY